VSTRSALEREAHRLAAIVNSSEDAIVSKSLDGIVQTWNNAAERMFGYTAHEIVGKSIRLIIPADRMSEEDSVLGRIRAGVSIEHFETVRQRKDGTLVDISLSVSPIKAANGRVVGASKIARDITAQRRLARALEEANRVKDEFLATLSHELRTPLNAVLGYTRMLRDGHIAEDRQEHAIDIIERNAKVLSQLVGDVLDVSSIVTGKVTLKIGTCDLAAMASAGVDMVRPSADAKGIAMRLHGTGMPLTIHCDPARLQQVLWNLLTNAVKFTPRGGGIDTSVAIENSMAKITVSDTGVGIRPEVLPYVFQRFWQADTTVTRQLGGLGLGLALARHFVELHGGTLTAESKGEGLGATFTITLPIVG
jgi:PAS domain S-box-containing protein